MPVRITGLLLSACFLLCRIALADDQPQWGQPMSRNMVSGEKGLPHTCDPASGAGIRWAAKLGTQTYSTPVVARGRVLIGTNNGVPRDPRHQGDRGVLMCLDEKDGSLHWQLVCPKLDWDPYLDWTGIGICASPVVEGNRVYLLGNRCEVLCLDLDGLANGNDGPFVDEAAFMAPRGREPIPPAALDADVIWRLDLRKEAGVHPHDASAGSVLILGRHLYVAVPNGNDNTHRRNPAPDAPGLVVVDKATGRLLGRDDTGCGHRTIHSLWSSPSSGSVGGRRLVFFAAGDGVCYALEPLESDPPPGEVKRLRTVWKFDCDPDAPKEDIFKWQDNRREGPSTISGMPVFHEGRVYVAAGGDVWHGKPWSWLKCIDAAAGSGDITASGQVWSWRMNGFCMSTPAIHDGLVYITDCARNVHCLEAATGKPLWTHRTRGEIWASPLVADGKVYVATRRGELVVFAAGREKNVLSTIEFNAPINATPVAANGTLYVATMTHLYAITGQPGAGR